MVREDLGGIKPQEPLEFVCVTLTEDYKGYAGVEGMDWSFWYAPDSR